MKKKNRREERLNMNCGMFSNMRTTEWRTLENTVHVYRRDLALISVITANYLGLCLFYFHTLYDVN